MRAGIRAVSVARRVVLVLPLFTFGACSKYSSARAPSITSSTTVNMLEGQANSIQFESPYAKGTIHVDAGVLIHYQSTSVNAVSHASWTINGRDMLFNGPELEIGDKNFGPLQGETSIEIRADGVFVNGERRGDLPR